MTTNEMILTRIPVGYCAHNIAPLGEDPNWVIEVAPHIPDETKIFGYDARELMERQYIRGAK